MDDWDLSKVSTELAHDGSSNCAVLLTTGALNPAHRGHVDALRRARRCLETQGGYTVIGGFVSPSHDSYVQTKVSGKDHAKAAARLALLEALIADEEDLTPWVSAAAWESSPKRSGWPDYPVVIDSLRATLDANGFSDITLFYCCGSDHARYIPGGFPRKRKVGVVVTARTGASPKRSIPDKLIYGVIEVNTKVEGLSSTKVRKALNVIAKMQGTVSAERAMAAVEIACGPGLLYTAQQLGVYGLIPQPEAAAAAAAAAADPRSSGGGDGASISAAPAAAAASQIK